MKTDRKKMIEVAIPLEPINREAASTLGEAPYAESR
jgi:hypothetical protein